MSDKLVSVIIPSKNRHDLILRAIASVAAQDYETLEIIVVDDGSNPKLEVSELIKAGNGRALHLIRNDVSVGGARSRNIGISRCKGDFCAFLDDDDIYYPNKISVLYDELKRNPHYDVAFGRTLLNNGVCKRYPIKYPVVFSRKTNIRLMNYIHTGSSLIRKEGLKNVRFLDCLTRYQDLQFYLELTVKTNIKFVDVDVCEWTVDDRLDQITSNSDIKKQFASYEAFKHVTSYLKCELNLDLPQLSQYELRTYVLGLKARRYSCLASIFIFALNPKKVVSCLYDYVERKRMFNL